MLAVEESRSIRKLVQADAQSSYYYCFYLWAYKW